MTTEVKRGFRRSYGPLWTTGQVASLVNASHKTVRRWIDSGKLEGIRFPGDREHRVHRDVLRQFLVDHSYTWAMKEFDARVAQSK